MAYGNPTPNNPYGSAAVNAIVEPESSAYYCTTADIVARIGQLQLARLTADNVGATTPDAVKVAAAILKGASYIDSQLEDVYTLPLVSVPQTLRDMNVTFAIYYMMNNRFSELAMPKEWKAEYEQSMKDLLEIASMDQTLPGNEPIATPAAEIQLHHRPFGHRHEHWEQY